MPPELEPMFRSATLLFVLLNPFLLSIYLLELVATLDPKTFRRVLARAGLISTAVFVVFALTGDAMFRDVLQVRFASFLVFGGVVFLLIGIRFVMSGQLAIEQLRAPPEHIAGAIAMPFMIGPGTVSASILAGARQPALWATLAIVLAMMAVVVCLVALKALHDRVKASHAKLVERYVDIVGRLSALVVGSIAIDMILNGIELWLSAER